MAVLVRTTPTLAWWAKRRANTRSFSEDDEKGDRLNFLYRDLVPHDEVVPTLARVLECFAAEKERHESLGDFCHRLGAPRLLERCEPPAE